MSDSRRFLFEWCNDDPARARDVIAWLVSRAVVDYHSEGCAASEDEIAGVMALEVSDVRGIVALGQKLDERYRAEAKALASALKEGD